MKKLIFTTLLTAFFVLDFFGQKKPEKLKVCITQQEYEIYEAIGIVNFQNETITEPLSENLETQFPGISKATIADFNKNNSEKYLLRCFYKADGKKKTLKKSYGGNFSQTFSRAGFSPDGREALVYNSWSAVGNYCGAEFVLLRKSNEKWEIIKKFTTFIC